MAERSPEREPPQPEPGASAPVRALLVAAGALFVGLGAVGAVLPLLPTTPFLLVAAACFARSSPRLYRALLASRAFGPLIRHWRAAGAIPRRAKIVAVAMIAAVGGSSVAFAVPGVAPRLAVAGLLAALALWIATRPGAEAAAPGPPPQSQSSRSSGSSSSARKRSSSSSR